MVELSISWLLLLPVLAFALGWASSRLDLRQVRRASKDSPRAYYKGLNLLLNEQQDKAIDAFIEAVQHDPDTTELHFALGNLFRRRGEFERSVRVHQHLLARADLPAQDRDRAQHALAQDYAKAGLFDRAEAAYRALQGTAFELEASRALLDLYERSRDWALAQEAALRLQAMGAGSYTTRIAHHLCEQALQAETAGPRAVELLQQAHKTAPQASRPLILLGQRHAREGRAEQALQTWSRLLELQPCPIALVCQEIATLGAGGEEPLNRQARDLLRRAYEAQPSLQALQALQQLEPEGAAAGLRRHLAQHPSLSSASLALQAAQSAGQALDADTLGQVQRTVERCSLPLRRYRCAACGFESHRYFWQCPGCLSWDSYPPQTVEEL